MPDLLESAHPRGGNRTLASDPPALVLEATPARPRIDTTPVLVFEQVSKWYGPVIGINQVTLELRPGITGLVGHNGSGKTTLLRMASGHTAPDLGRVSVMGHEAWSTEAKRHVGYCPEHDRFYEEMTGRRFVQCMARLCGYSRVEARRRTEETLELLGMADRANRPIAGYSKGMRQRVKLAQALLHDPELLLLDEPLSGIDPIGRREFIELFQKLARRGKCLLISSHELEELEKLTDHVAIMAAGRIAAVGTLTQIRDLLDDHPLSIHIAADGPYNLAGSLLAMEEVVSVERLDNGALLIRARNPRRFFQKLASLIIEESVEIRHLETLDESTHDVLGYLLGGRPRR